MFKHITIDLRIREKLHDMGFICEHLLYYEKVTLNISTCYIEKIIADFGYDNLIELLGRNMIAFSFEDSMYLDVQIKADGESDEDAKNRCLIPLSNPINHNENESPSWENHLLQHLKNSVPPNKVEILVALILDRANVLDIDGKLNKQIWNDLLDEPLLNEVTRLIIAENGAIAPADFSVKAIKESSTTVRFVPNHPFSSIFVQKSFQASDMIRRFLDYNRDIYLSSFYDSNISSDKLVRTVFELKANRILVLQDDKAQNIEKFKEMIFGSPFLLRQKINNKILTIDEFVSVLVKAQDLGFKSWLSDLAEGESIIHEYHQKLNEKTLMQKIYEPMSGIKLLFLNGIGFIAGAVLNPVAAASFALGVGIADQMLFDKINAGWRPGIFVNKYLKDI